VEDDVGVHVVRRCSARLAPASALALWGVGRGLSARDACVDAAAQERRARHEARHMCGEATSPSSSSSAITSPFVKQLPLRKDLRTGKVHACKHSGKTYFQERAHRTQ
jgi:hypothetical protein